MFNQTKQNFIVSAMQNYFIWFYHFISWLCDNATKKHGIIGLKFVGQTWLRQVACTVTHFFFI